MIPVNLSFSGLNSYRQIQNIDFKDLAAQGLFGIFGVTGAGKSTILDAITLALFGEVRRALRQTQGIINVQEKTCFVSFSFELGEHVYRAERLFEREKNKAFSCRQKSCRLIMDDELTLADKGGAMDDAVKELLNMDCNRFCQTVILPQGEFDQILRFKPAERSAMLEKLFHFGEYGEVLGRRCRTKLKISEAQVSSILEQFSVLGEHDDDFLKKSREQLDSLRRELAENDILYQNAQKSFRDINALADQNM